MLAYVFWHRRIPGTSRQAYETALANFQESLKEARLEGFLAAFVLRFHGAPWMNQVGEEAYEDWYLMTGSDVLDRLNEIAVSGERKEPHDKAARAATDIHGGLYRLRSGDVSRTGGEWATWLSKPQGTSYDSFYNQISEYSSHLKGSLWRRQMVLGPTTEFCLTASTKLTLPSAFHPIYVHRELVWHDEKL